MSVIQLHRGRSGAIPDHRGPMARLRNVMAEPSYAVAEIGRRIAQGESLRQIARSWSVPRHAFEQWFGALLIELARSAKAQEAARPEPLI